MIREVVQYGNEVLRQVAEPAEDNDYSRQVIQDLKDTLSEIPNGAGLAAPQIGESVRIFATRNYKEGTRDIIIFVNPEIIEESEEMVDCPDGCLSMKNVSAITKRNSFLTISFLDENFEKQEMEIQGFQSCVFQHENDHLNGVLFTDRLEEEEKLKAEDVLEKNLDGGNYIYAGGKVVTMSIEVNENTNNE